MFEGDKLQTGGNWMPAYEMADIESFNDVNVGRDEFCFSSSMFDNEDTGTFYLSQPATQSLPLVNCPICSFSFIGPAYADHYARCLSQTQSTKSVKEESPAFSNPIPAPKRKPIASRPIDQGVNKKMKKAAPTGKRPPKAAGVQPVIEPKRRIDVKYDPDKHCGVWIVDQERHCTRSLSCKAHAIAKRRLVPNRSDVFDAMLAAHRAARKNMDRRGSGPTCENNDKAGSEGEKPPAVRPPMKLPLDKDSVEHSSPIPVPCVDTPPSNDIPFCNEGSNFSDFDSILGEDDFLDDFKDLPGVDCFLGTPVSQASSDSPLSQDSGVSDSLVSDMTADVAGHISLSEELARCFPTIPVQYYLCREAESLNQSSPGLTINPQPRTLHTFNYQPHKVDMQSVLSPPGKVSMLPAPAVELQLNSFHQNAIKRHKSSISNVETKLPHNVLALLSKSNKRQQVKRPRKQRLQRHQEPLLLTKVGQFPDAIACCT